MGLKLLMFVGATTWKTTLGLNSASMLRQHQHHGDGCSSFHQVPCTWTPTIAWYGVPQHASCFRLHAMQKDSNKEVVEMLTNYDLDPYELGDDVLTELAVEIFAAYDVGIKFGVKDETLRSFLQEVRGRYNTPDFHSYRHAWATLFLTYQILRKGKADSFLSTLECFALLVASLCHDLEHPGNDNHFEKATDSESARMYEDSFLERHHCAVALSLLDSTLLLGGLSDSDAAKFRETVTGAIMLTDMSQHFQLVDKLTSSDFPHFVADDERATFAGVILHSADIGAQTLRLDQAQKWGERAMDEFMKQAENEKLLGVPPTPYLQCLEDECVRASAVAGAGRGLPSTDLCRQTSRGQPVLLPGTCRGTLRHSWSTCSTGKRRQATRW